MNNTRPMRGAMPPMVKIKGSTVRRLLKYISNGNAGRLIFVMVCILLSSLAGIGSAFFIQRLIDGYLRTDGTTDFAALAGAAAVMAAIYAVGVLSTLLYNRKMVTIAQGTLKRIRDDMFNHMQTLPIRYFDAHTYGDVMSYYTNDTDTLRQMISQSLAQVFSSIATILAVLAAMLTLSWQMTLFVLFTVALMVLLSRGLAARSGRHFVMQQVSLGKMNGYIEEMIHGQKVVKVFCHEEEAKAGFDALNEALCDHATKANSYANTLMPIMGNLGNLQYVLVAAVGGAAAVNGVAGVTIGTIASFLLLSKNFTQPINMLSQQVNNVAMALAGAERIFSFIDEQPEQDSGDVTLVNVAAAPDGSVTESAQRTGLWAWKQPRPDGSAVYTQLKGDVRFFDVDFGYVPDKTVLHGVSLYAKPGQKLAFVGATGAGKTTITNLINRFYDLADGKIRYDGININRIRKSDLRRSLGMVLQDVNLFTGTVMDNIRYGRLDASDDDCIRAARESGAHGFISMLPQGYQTVISGDGSSLSQGQCQLLSIARAAVSDPPVMILDEATSTIDTRTEAIVQRGMDALMRGRTVFVIAHRLSTVKNADAILVLSEGRVIERGTHEQLIAARGTYYALYTGAFELE